MRYLIAQVDNENVPPSPPLVGQLGPSPSIRSRVGGRGVDSHSLVLLSSAPIPTDVVSATTTALTEGEKRASEAGQPGEDRQRHTFNVTLHSFLLSLTGGGRGGRHEHRPPDYTPRSHGRGGDHNSEHSVGSGVFLGVFMWGLGEGFF